MARFRIQGTAYKQRGSQIVLLPGAVVRVSDPSGDQVRIYSGPTGDDSPGFSLVVSQDAAIDFYVDGLSDYYDMLITAGRFSVDERVYNYPQRSQFNSLLEFVGFFNGGEGPGGSTTGPGAVTSFTATPQLGGFNLTWNTAPDNGFALTSQNITYLLGGVLQTINLGPAATDTFVAVAGASVQVTFNIQAFTQNGGGPIVSASPATTWAVPGSITGVDYIRQDVGFADIEFNAATSPDTPVTGYPFRIVRTTGDQSETTGVLPATAREIRVDLPSDDETVDLYIRASNAVGDGPEFGPFNVAGVTVPTGAVDATATPAPGGVLISSNGVASTGGAPVESWVIETTP